VPGSNLYVTKISVSNRVGFAKRHDNSLDPGAGSAELCRAQRDCPAAL